LNACCTGPSSGVDQSLHSGTHQGCYEVSKGVDRPRVFLGFGTRNVFVPEGCPPTIPTGRSDRGGGGTVGGGTVGAWRPRYPKQ